MQNKRFVDKFVQVANNRGNQMCFQAMFRDSIFTIHSKLKLFIILTCIKNYNQFRENFLVNL